MAFALQPSPSHTKVILMMMILKIVGLAFERDSVMTKLREQKENDDAMTNFEKKILNISFVDAFHYCFNYIGLLVGKSHYKKYL